MRAATDDGWRYWSDGSYPADCRSLFRTRGDTEQQAYRADTDAWEDVPQDVGGGWPLNLLQRRAEVTGDFDRVPVEELPAFIAGHRSWRRGLARRSTPRRFCHTTSRQ